MCLAVPAGLCVPAPHSGYACLDCLSGCDLWHTWGQTLSLWCDVWQGLARGHLPLLPPVETFWEVQMGGGVLVSRGGAAGHQHPPSIALVTLAPVSVLSHVCLDLLPSNLLPQGWLLACAAKVPGHLAPSSQDCF